MDTPFETNFGYTSDTDAERAVDEDGDESGIGEEQPEGPFNLAELEILARRRREWTQARKKEKAIILREIYKEFTKIGRNRDLSLAECQEKEEKITAWLKKPLRTRKPRITIQSAYKYSVRSVVQEIYHEQIQEKHVLMQNEGAMQGDNKCIDLYQQALTTFIQDDLTDEQLAAAHDIAEKWNGPEGPSAEVQARNVKKYVLKFMKNFAEEMWRYCRMRMVSLTGWKDEDGAIQACWYVPESPLNDSTISGVQSMDFNSDIASGSAFNDIHTLDATWRDYLGTAYENPDFAGGEDVPNMAAHRPRAKKGAPVELVTNEDGEIWIGDLIGRSHDTILQMVRGYLTAHYRQACRRRSATVPFKKLGRYQAEMIASRHLPQNFSFTVDPSHMHLSAARELLNFWRERQITNPSDVFSFQKWLDQSGNLWEPSDGSFKPLEIARKRKHQSWEASTSTDGSTSDEDRDPDNKYGALTATSVLEDTTEYPDSDGFESIPFADAHTAKPGPSGQHRINGKLKSALKQIPRSEVQNMDQQPESQKVIGNSLTRKPRPRKPAQKKGTISGAGNDQGLVGLPAAEGSQWKSPRAHRPPIPADANVPSPKVKKSWKAVKTSKKRI
ncbi:hypothetical protein BKA83DRAFT_4488748 [Pisolithus microcarpus]|nr:hypothetical protein BKA83DRAFT_4488748 [Pisolithus microcarpus]